jgi:hypothetical protein
LGRRRAFCAGGQLIATFPFAHVAQESVIKAVVEHPVPDDAGVSRQSRRSAWQPCVTIPGWDIVDIARAAGFAIVNMVAMSSRKFSIIADIPILVMRAVC